MKKIATKIFSVMVLVLTTTDVMAQATMDSLDSVANNQQGIYTPQNLDYLGFGSIGMTQNAWLDPLQNLGEGQTKPAYSKYYWSPDLVLPVRLREGMLTLINFPEWELLEDVYIGDSKNFTGEISGPNTLLLYPQGGKVGLDTNIIVFGRSGNKYVFYAKSESFNTERLTNSVIDIEVVDDNRGLSSSSGVSGGSLRSGGKSGSSYKGGKNSVDSTFTKRFQKEDWIQNIPLDPTKMRFDIEVYVPNPDDVVIAPERVWRDDIFTYIDFGDRALSMVQRPIVTLIVERSETPVGFRSAGPDNRLIIVEGVGDMVLRNGKRLVCLKLRRSDEQGTEFSPMAETNNWDVPYAIPGGKKPTGEGAVQGFDFVDINKKEEPAPVNVAPISSAITLGGGIEGGMPGVSVGQGGYAGQSGIAGQGGYNAHEGSGYNIVTGEYTAKLGPNGELVIPEYAKAGNNAGFPGNAKFGMNAAGANKTGFNKSDFSGYRFGKGFDNEEAASISVELGTDANVSNLEDLWRELSTRYNSVLGEYKPFYSVDAPADGQGKELFHLRIGPVQSIDVGDEICGQLGRNGVFCSVVRVQ